MKVISKGAQIFPESKSYLKILGARMLIWHKFHTESQQY